MTERRVVILGAGPAGVGAAFQLRRLDRAPVTVLEQRETVGGNAGSFEIEGQRVDYGSHRLHPACDPAILADIRGLLGGELLQRPRHGRIRLKDKWIHFPLKPLDLLLRLDRGFAWGILRETIRKRRPPQISEENFASVILAQLGSTIGQEFYLPYARKIWGREPEDLAAVQARRRVAANSVIKLARKVLGRLPGVKPLGFRHYYYPRSGYGAISEAYADAARAKGAEILLGWRVTRLDRPERPGNAWRVTAEREGQTRVMEAGHVWSTIPLPVLARVVSPRAPEPVIEAAGSIHYRAMLLVYLTVGVDHFSEYDAHYFPEPIVAITRLSEPKNYAASSEPRGRTTLCAELPCAIGDKHWTLDDLALGEGVADDLARAGIPLPARPIAVAVRRLAQAYPIYERGYEGPFRALDEWVAGLAGLLTYGRQGLFAHDNTHHALAMAYAAVDCLRDGDFDHEHWQNYRKVFETHVVED